MDSPSRPGRVVWHTTESGAGNAAFDAVGKYLRQISAEPHVLYDPTTDRIGQFGPLNKSARALKNDGSVRTNRTGKVCIQIEVLGRAATPFTGYWKPGPNFRALMAAIRSWGVPDVFPMGALATKYGDSAAKRTESVWLSEGGHYGHSNVPGNNHWDPGAISKSALFAAAHVATPPAPSKPSTPKPVIDLSKVVTAARTNPPMAKRTVTYAGVADVKAWLIAEGLLVKSDTDGHFGQRVLDAYKAWQRRCGYSGAAADGVPGMTSLRKLAVKHGRTVTA
ncbi:endolysin [Streptomyces phage phiSASD1]|uniref:Gp40 n=1 Tax=Streptomyces phage phiSASD1 TaxID=747763 RepID=D7NW66_9CAUD|nr:endolysin [Streptomyces phage phiSASD1]ADE43464.1 gp40 [Streptomyces phage phiSASD1]